MDFIAFLGVLRRHFVVVGVCLLLTVGAVFAAVQVVKPKYEASATIILLAPETPSQTDSAPTQTTAPHNPYLSFGSNLGIMANVLETAFLDPRLQTQLQKKGATESYELSYGGGDTPSLTVAATGKTPASTMRTLHVVLDNIDPVLSQRQVDVGASDQFLIHSTLLRIVERPQTQQGSRIRAAVAIMILGVGFAIGMAFLIEALQNPVGLRRLRKPRPTTNASILERDYQRRASKVSGDDVTIWYVSGDQPEHGQTARSNP